MPNPPERTCEAARCPNPPAHLFLVKRDLHTLDSAFACDEHVGWMRDLFTDMYPDCTVEQFPLPPNQP